MLLERARGLLADPHQEMLALEVDASPPVAALTPPPPQPTLAARARARARARAAG
jgi:hypothetical protein